MAQEVIGGSDIASGQPGWDTNIDSNQQLLEEYITSFAMSSVSGTAGGAAATVSIQRQTTRGAPTNVAGAYFLRIRISDDNSSFPAWGDASTATLGSVTTGTLRETITANKEVIVESDSSGLIVIEVNNSVAETTDLVIGPPPLYPTFSNYHNFEAVEHV